MAASRVASSRRLCARYKFFFYIAVLMLGLQLFLGYSFYNSINITDVERFDGRDHGDRAPRKVSFDIRQDSQADSHGKQPEHRPHPDQDKMVTENGGKGPPDKGHLLPNLTLPSTYKPKCEIRAKEALSAISRATTTACRQQIADISCLTMEGKMYAETLPRLCPLKGNDTGTYFGCYKDNLNDRDLTGTYKELSDNTPHNCMNYCLKAGFRYAGVQYSKECWCGDSYGKHGHSPESLCEGRCSGDSSQKCGGYLTSKIYSTGVGEKKRYQAPLVRAGSTEAENTVRIVFVLTLSGRQVRQVVRLLRNIFHPQHYYFLHIDKRQEFMYRELLPLEKQLSNILVSKTRFSTIWGGASLLQAHLHFMKELLEMPWAWDYYINLSESDYPIKPVKDLTAFLSLYKTYNFLKSHGRDTPRFIQKQGLDQTFYECDSHLWRIGPRKLPGGIRIDGGSDWVCLYRKYVQYLVTTQDELVTGLKQLYKYSLLPAESFFHTVLVNSVYCTKVVDNNLHLTNWRRKQGCKCQHKHVVDWCGCSPNDFKISDLDRLMNYEQKPIFFARKFEPIVNQEIINSLDVYLFGNFQQDMTGLTSYWQNEYHHLDKIAKVKDAYPTFYQSFVRLGVAELSRQSVSCTYRPMKTLEANVFYEADHFHGILVLHQVEEVATGNIITMETHMHPKHHYSILQPKTIIGRLQTLEVGTDFDPKELLFRNYGKLIGPYDDVVLRHVWGAGIEFVISVAWIDPVNVIAASYDVKVLSSGHTGSHKPQLNQPLRPGIWQVKLMYNLQILAETSFLVIPLTVYDGHPISATEIYRAHSGPQGFYASKDFSEFRDVLNVPKQADLETQAAVNAKKVGKDLENWVDSLVPLFWQVQRSCTIEDLSNTCLVLEQCKKTSWSSRSPDPKSDLSSVGAKFAPVR
ncbi:xylosyltransferase oxt-like [Haliotis asinina]|uniref:xylosyltransferase oxt-like n=1 Tax=Haliotis asinina TaxID=109174 RepID=UPI003531D2EE